MKGSPLSLHLMFLTIALSTFSNIAYATDELAKRLPYAALMTYLPHQVNNLAVVSADNTPMSRRVAATIKALLHDNSHLKSLQTGESLGDLSRLNDSDIAARARSNGFEHVFIIRTFADNAQHGNTIVMTSYTAAGYLWAGVTLEPQQVLQPKAGLHSAGEGMSDDTRSSINHGATAHSERTYTAEEIAYLEERLYVVEHTPEGKSNGEVRYIQVYRGGETTPLDAHELYTLLGKSDDAKRFESQATKARWWEGTAIGAAVVGGLFLGAGLQGEGEKLSPSSCRGKADEAACQAHNDKENGKIDQANSLNYGAAAVFLVGGAWSYMHAESLHQTASKIDRKYRTQLKAAINDYNGKLQSRHKLAAPPYEHGASHDSAAATYDELPLKDHREVKVEIMTVQHSAVLQLSIGL